MPTLTSSDHSLTSSDRLTTKSALRHRPITPTLKCEESPRIPRASLTQTRKPAAGTSTPPGTQKSTAGASASGSSIEVPVWISLKKSQALPQRIPLVGIGIGMVIAIIVVFLGQLLIGWLGNTLDDLHYGYPRTYQIDAVVGHHDSLTHQSHFVALNLKGQIEIIELPGGEASHAKIYLGPHLYGSNADLAPVTLQFVQNTQTHQPDMLVLVQGERIVFQNGQGIFHAPSISMLNPDFDVTVNFPMHQM